MSSNVAHQLCKSCGSKMMKGKSRCNNCGQWHIGPSDKQEHVVRLNEAKDVSVERYLTGPWDEVFGGGIVKTSAVLIGAIPGAGKSTISLQIADSICEQTKRDILYIAAENHEGEIKSYADRLQIKNQEKMLILPSLGNYEGLHHFDSIIEKYKPAAMFLDSVIGLVGQDHDSALMICKVLKGYSVKSQSPVMIVDHVNKQEDFAGLMALQHEVDVLLTLLVDERTGIRTLACPVKNRFGRTPVEIDLIMTEQGLKTPEDMKDE